MILVQALNLDCGLGMGNYSFINHRILLLKMEGKNFSKKEANGIVDSWEAIVPIILPQKLRQKIYLILDMVKLRQVLKLLTVRFLAHILVTSN